MNINKRSPRQLTVATSPPIAHPARVAKEAEVVSFHDAIGATLLQKLPEIRQPKQSLKALVDIETLK